ncbi:hypothetical protein [Candidatus Igneacidithiobacillus taiwanensis]|nr:hypothetical protein [Candidatus Igneacidithiobacillus taiwanensis]
MEKAVQSYPPELRFEAVKLEHYAGKLLPPLTRTVAFSKPVMIPPAN